MPGLPLLLAWQLAAASPSTAMAGPSSAPTTPTATGVTAPAVPDIPFTRFVLENGFEVIVVEDHRVPLVAVDLWVHTGSGDEQPKKTGFAHLFEHMMFQGAEHIGTDVHFDVLKKLGATGINGTTNSDRTNYYEVVPTHQLETALWLESDRLGFLLPMLTKESLANQRDVVRNERRQRYDDVPYGRERFATHAALYPEGHPYRYLTIGRHEDIENASVDDVRAFWLQRYTPSNATLAIVGDVTIDAARALVDHWFGSLRKAPKPAPTKVTPPTLAADVRVDVDDPFARLVRLRWAWHSPRAFEDDDYDLAILADALGASGWGRLQKALVVENPIAQSVSVMQSGVQLSGTFQIAVTLKPGTDPALVERIVASELQKIVGEGPTDVELSRSVLNTDSSFLWGLEDLFTRAERLQSFRHYVGDPGYLRTYLQRLHARSTTSVKAAAQKWLRRPHALIVTRPAPAGATSVPSTSNGSPPTTPPTSTPSTTTTKAAAPTKPGPTTTGGVR